MPSHLLIEATDRMALLLAALAITTTAKALTSVLRTWIEQASRTRRLVKALEDAKPRERPGIIMACGQLEGRSAGGSDSDKGDGVFPANEHPRPPVLILRNKRSHDCHGD